MRRHVPLICSITCLLACALLAREAAAKPAPEARTGKKHVILINPLGPVLGAAAGQLTLPTVSVNLRYQRAYSERLGLMVAPLFTRTEFIGIGNYVAAVKLGPRFSLSRRGLAGWYVAPMAVLGWGWVTQLDRRIHSSGIAGLSVEIGRAWHWRHFILELGGGVHYTGYVAHYSPLSGVSGEPPSAGFGPILNVSLGYGW